MKPGTPGFVGARLTEAREARGITAAGLGELLGVSRQSIYQYENDQQTPHPDTFHQIYTKLNLPAAFFLRSPQNHEASPVYFRCLSSTSASERIKSERKIHWLFDIFSFSAKFVDMPSVNLPKIDLPQDPTAIGEEQIEQAAVTTREHWKKGIGPIANIVRLLENNGIAVSRMTLESQKQNGFSKWINGRPFIVLAADKNCAARSRFDAAHELGHLILHRCVDREKLSNKPFFNMIETQAHRFAAAFLLPAQSFAADYTLPNLEQFRMLKEKWNCSIAMMIMRSEQLGFISEEQKQALFISYTRRDWRQREPLDSTTPVEQPQLLQKAFNLLLENNVKTAEDIVSSLPYARTDIEDLANLGPQYLSLESADVIRLKPAVNNAEADVRMGDQPGVVIQFRGNRSR